VFKLYRASQQHKINILTSSFTTKLFNISILTLTLTWAVSTCWPFFDEINRVVQIFVIVETKSTFNANDNYTLLQSNIILVNFINCQWRGHGGFGGLNAQLLPGQLLGFVQNGSEFLLGRVGVPHYLALAYLKSWLSITRSKQVSN
jgi:hypothetical protein